MRNKLPKNPYPGLRPFEFAENHLFFGREGQSEEVLRRLQESRFLAVVGTSGSGKSSLVRAGLLPLLYGGIMTGAGASWRVALFRPGDNPIHNLAEALVHPTQFTSSKSAQTEKKEEEENLKLAVTETVLRRSAVGLRDFANSNEFAEDENLLVVVDQFEELFRFKKENQSQIITEKSEIQENAENEAAAFVKLLIEATKDKTRRVYVVITMRSDFLGDCSQFRDLPETINNGQYLIPRLTTEQLRKAIESPAKVKGAKIQTALVARLLNDIGDDQDQLPVLQHSLMRTWDKWAEAGDKTAEISFEHYNATGGMTTALSEHADEAFFELGSKIPEEFTRKQKIAEKLFKCLTETDRENRETRRATTIGKICKIADASKEEVSEVIETFRKPGRTFLMPPQPEILDENTLIDISHESLIRKWDRLKIWVEEEAQSSQTYRRLAEDALLYQKGKVGFWSDPELKDALEWKESFKPNETWAELYSKTWGTRYLSTYPEAVEYLEASKKFREQELIDEENQKNREIEQERKLREIESEKAQVLKKSANTFKGFTVALAFMTLLLLAATGFAVYKAQEAQSNAEESKKNAYTATKNEETAKNNAEKARKSEANTNTALEETRKTNDKLTNTQIKLETSLSEQQKARKKAEEQTKIAGEQATRAKLSEAVANKNKQTALDERQKAVDERQKAESQKALAIAAYNQANEEKAKKEVALREAQTARDNADINFRKAEVAKGEAEKNRSIALKALEEANNTLVTLINVDNQTPNFNGIIRHNSAVNTSVFSSDSKFAVTSSNDGIGYLSELRNGSLEFNELDYADVASLSRKFSEAGTTDQLGSDTTSSYIFKLLSPPTKTLLINYDSTKDVDEPLTQLILGDFNKLLKNPSLYNPEAFKDVQLRKETRRLIKDNSSGENKTLLNRMLLEDAFSGEIIKFNQFHKTKTVDGEGIVISPNKELIASIGDGNKIKIYHTNAELINKIVSDFYIGNIAISPSNKYILATANNPVEGENSSYSEINNRLLIWEINTNNNQNIPIKKEIKAPIEQAVFSPDEEHIAIKILNSTEIQIWNINKEDKEISLAESKNISVNKNEINRKSANAEKNGKKLINSISYSKDGKYIAATFKDDKDARIWDAKSGELLQILRAHECQVNSAEFDNTGEKLVTAGKDGTVFIWNVSTGKVISELREHRGLLISRKRNGLRAWFPPIPFPLNFDLQHRGDKYISINSAKFSSDGKMVVTASKDGSVRIWDVSKGEKNVSHFKPLVGYTGNVRYAEFSPNMDFVIAAGDDGVARIWNTKSDESSKPESCEIQDNDKK